MANNAVNGSRRCAGYEITVFLRRPRYRHRYDLNSAVRERIGRSWTAPKPNVLARERRTAARQASPGSGVVFGMEAERCVDDLLGLSPASRFPRPKRNEFRSTISVACFCHFGSPSGGGGWTVWKVSIAIFSVG